MKSNSYNTTFPYIITERLQLREISLGDSKEIFSLLTKQDIAEYFQRPCAKTMDDAINYINKAAQGIKENQWLVWGIALRNTNKLIGTIVLWNYDYDLSKAEISYELLTEYQRKGYMTETLSKVLTFGFQQLELKYIEARTNKNNIPSLKLLSKFGFKQYIPKVKEIDPLAWDNPDISIYRIYSSVN